VKIGGKIRRQNKVYLDKGFVANIKQNDGKIQFRPLMGFFASCHWIYTE
jgi:hypothetical protein